MNRCVDNPRSHRATSIGLALCCLVVLVSTGAVPGLIDPWRAVVALPLLIAAIGFISCAIRLRRADRAPLPSERR